MAAAGAAVRHAAGVAPESRIGSNWSTPIDGHYARTAPFMHQPPSVSGRFRRVKETAATAGAFRYAGRTFDRSRNTVRVECGRQRGLPPRWSVPDAGHGCALLH